MTSSGRSRVLITSTWLLLLFANYTTNVRILGRWFKNPNAVNGRAWNAYAHYTFFGRILFFVYEFLNITALICHVRAVFGNPGTTKHFVPAAPPVSLPSPKLCKLCESRWKPPRAHHCRKCGVCIFRMDHHCAWIGNCVGIMNQKFFILFLIYSAILCIYQFVLLSFSFLAWLSHRPLTDFLGEQIESLETNSTLVESHQHTHGVQKPFSKSLVDVFGKRSLLWCFPTSPHLQLDYAEPVFHDKSTGAHFQLKKRRMKRQLERRPRAPLNTVQPLKSMNCRKSFRATYQMESTKSRVYLAVLPFSTPLVSPEASTSTLSCTVSHDSSKGHRDLNVRKRRDVSLRNVVSKQPCSPFITRTYQKSSQHVVSGVDNASSSNFTDTTTSDVEPETYPACYPIGDGCVTAAQRYPVDSNQLFNSLPSSH